MVSLTSDLGSNGAGYSGGILPNHAQHYENLANIGNSMQLKGQLGKPHTNNVLDGWSNDLDSRVALHDRGGNSGYLQDGNNPDLKNARLVSTKELRKKRKYRKASKGKNNVYSFDEKNGVEEIISQFNLENADRVDVRSNSSIVAGDVYEIIRNGQKIKTGKLLKGQAGALAGVYAQNSEEPAPQETTSLVYSKGDKGFKKLAEILEYNRNTETIVFKPENHQNNPIVTYELLDRRGEVISIGDLTAKPAKFKKLPSYVAEQISEMMDAAEKKHKSKEKKSKIFYAEYGLDGHSDDEGFTVNAKGTGLIRVHSEEGKLIALQVEGAYGRTEGGIEEIALAAGPVAKFTTKSGRVISIAGFYQWLEKNGYDAGSVEHSQVGIALGTEKDKDKFRLYIGLPLSGEQLEKSTSSSSINTTVEDTDTYVRTIDTKTTTITEQVQEAVVNLTLSWEHWFKEWFAGRIGVFYAGGVGYHVKGIEHHVDQELKGIFGGTFKWGDFEIRPEVRVGQGKPEYSLRITYTPGLESSNGKAAGDGGSQEKPELFVPVEIEPIKTVRYEKVKEVIEETATTNYKATIEDLVLSVDGNDITARWSGKDREGDEITLYRYKVESENSGWTETQDNSVTIEDIAKGEHNFSVQAYSNGKWGRASQEGFNISNSAPKIGSLEGVVDGNDIIYSWTASDQNPEDTITKYNYRIDGGNWTETTATQLTKKNMTKGSHTFEVMAYDGTDWSDVKETTSDIANRAPTMDSLETTVNGNDATINWTASDPDSGDTITKYNYRLDSGGWTETTATQLNLEDLAKGSHTVDVKAYDGTDWSSAEQDTFNIANRAPSASNVDLPDDPIATVTDLTLSYAYSDADSDAESGTTIRWYKNGVLQSAYNDQTTISKDVLVAGDTWYAKVKPNDGTEFGTEVQSDTVTVQGAPPPPPP